jgi:hypothetical protein
MAGKAPAAGESRFKRKRGDGPIKFRTNFRNTVRVPTCTADGELVCGVQRADAPTCCVQVYDVLRTRPGWVETESETEWDFQWAERDWVYESFDTMHLDAWQRMNHYRNGREVSWLPPCCRW